MSARIDLTEGRARSLLREGIARLHGLDPRWWLGLMGSTGAAEAAQWDEHYEAEEDPYGYAQHRDHYRRRLALLGDRRFGRALELACSIGVFTEMLAPRCDELLAVDISDVAVQRARARLGELPGVKFGRRTFPEEAPPGPFDLIVCADFLYYLDRSENMEGLRRLESALAPGGWLLAVHWRPATPTHTMSGDAVQRLLVRETTLRHALRRTEWAFRYDLFERA